LASIQPGSRLAITPVQDASLDEFGTPFVIKVWNTTKAPVTFDTSGMIVKSDGRTLTVLDFEGFKQAVKIKENVAQVRAAVFGIAAGVGAGAYAGQSGANPAVAAALSTAAISVAGAATVAAADAKADGEYLVDDTKRQLVSSVVIPPGKAVEGLIIVEGLEFSPASAEISVGADTHAFTMVRQ
jgi:hypothetical protein